jgi:hypothetical protein
LAVLRSVSATERISLCAQCRPVYDARAQFPQWIGVGMAKVLALLLLAAMVLHIIRPLGLPGLRKRGDFWKIAVVALVAISLTALAGHW